MDRIQRTRAKGSKLLPNTLCVTRGTLWGSDYKVVETPFGFEVHHKGELYEMTTWTTKELATERAVELFKRDITPMYRDEFLWACRDNGIEHLACWCGLNDKCHADVWLEIWNSHKLPFTDPSIPTPEDDAARLAGYQGGTAI